MKMKIDTPARLATVTLGEDTALDIPALDLFIRKAMDEPCGLMALELIVPAGDMNSPQLQKRGFVVAGSVTQDTVTQIKMRKRLSAPSFADKPRPTFNPEIAVPAPTLHTQTKEEQAAHSNLSASLDRFYSESASNARLAALEAEVSKFRSGKSVHKDIQANANRLATAIMRKPDGAE